MWFIQNFYKKVVTVKSNAIDTFFTKTVNGNKDVSIMALQDEQ